MLLNLLICVGLFFAIVSIVGYRRILNPVFIILIWYIIGILISHSGLFGMYKPADMSSEFILFNIIILCCTFFIVTLTKSLKSVQITEYFFVKKFEKFFSFMRILTFLVEVIIAVHLTLSILTGAISISSIRLLVYSLAYDSDAYTQIFFNKIIYNIFNFFIKGFILFDVSWNLCQVVTENKKIRCVSLINLFLYCFIILSRIEILRIFIIFALVIISIRYTRNKTKRNNKARNKNYKKIIIFFAIIMFVTFSIRTSSGASVVVTSIQEVIISLTGSYVVFGNFFASYLGGLRLIDSNIIAILFGGLEPVFYVLLKPLGITSDLPTSKLNEYISLGTNIGASDHYNAFYTMYYNFLASGGVLGCVLVSILLGTLLGVLYKSYIKKPTSESLLIYIFGLHIVIFGSIRWELGTFSIWFMLILIILLMYKEKKLN